MKYSTLPVRNTLHRICSCCHEPMTSLGLTGRSDSVVAIDHCDPCMLIWFDDTESTRLAGPALVDLIRLIHERISSEGPRASLPANLACPVCTITLSRTTRRTLYGRTTLLTCPNHHGAYQTYLNFLSERGFFRPYTAGDIEKLRVKGTNIHCAQCGASLDTQPHDNCPFCDAPVGVIDPARLASAIDVENVNRPSPLKVNPDLYQTSCPNCGVSVDATQHEACPNCRTILPPQKTLSALQAAEFAAKNPSIDSRWHVFPSFYREDNAIWFLFATLIAFVVATVLWLIFKPETKLDSITEHYQGFWALSCKNNTQGIEIGPNTLKFFNGKDQISFPLTPKQIHTNNIDFGSGFQLKNDISLPVWIGSLRFYGTHAFLDWRDSLLAQRFPFKQSAWNNPAQLSRCGNSVSGTHPTPLDEHEESQRGNQEQGYAIKSDAWPPPRLRSTWAQLGQCSVGPFIQINEQTISLTQDGRNIDLLAIRTGLRHEIPWSDVDRKNIYAGRVVVEGYSASLSEFGNELHPYIGINAAIGLHTEFVGPDGYLARGNFLFIADKLQTNIFPLGLNLIEQCLPPK